MHGMYVMMQRKKSLSEATGWPFDVSTMHFYRELNNGPNSCSRDYILMESELSTMQAHDAII